MSVIFSHRDSSTFLTYFIALHFIFLTIIDNTMQKSRGFISCILFIHAIINTFRTLPTLTLNSPPVFTQADGSLQPRALQLDYIIQLTKKS